METIIALILFGWLIGGPAEHVTAQTLVCYDYNIYTGVGEYRACTTADVDKFKSPIGLD